MRILVVEDNLTIQKLVTLLASRHGIDADIVGTCCEAVDRVKFDPTEYALLMMDWTLPDCDGLECTRRIRALEPPKNAIPIVAMTANCFDGDRERCLEAGMDGYLSKPFTKSEFIEAVRTWARPSRSHTALTPELSQPCRHDASTQNYL